MKYTFFTIPIILFFCVLTSCEAEPREDTNRIADKIIAGRIDGRFLREFETKDKNVKTILVISPGGDTSTALKIAQRILKEQLGIAIAELCLSACAEYFLPPAKKITLIDEPLIGYHWNPVILGHLLETHAEKDLNYCDNVGDKELMDLLQNSGKRTDAWKNTLQRIRLTKYEVEYKAGECPWSVREFEYKYWFPTSSQLKEIFGISVTGKLCADSQSCYERKIRHYFHNAGGKFIVGDAEFSLFDTEMPIENESP